MRDRFTTRPSSSFALPLRTSAAALALAVVVGAPSFVPATPSWAASEGKAVEPMRGAPNPAAQEPAAQPPAEMVSGKVLETMDAANYTYVRIAAPSGEIWAAGPKTQIKAGETVSFLRGMAMKNFHSKALNRDFESIDFVGRLIVKGRENESGEVPMPAGGSPHGGGTGGSPHAGVNAAAPAAIDLTGIAKAEGGKTVAEVFDERADLKGKEVTVRGKAVKVTVAVMGHNWVHVRDGSRASDGSDDLTATTDDKVQVGDTVLVTGKVATDKDIGAGYHYAVLLEEAKVKVE